MSRPQNQNPLLQGDFGLYKCYTARMKKLTVLIITLLVLGLIYYSYTKESPDTDNTVANTTQNTDGSFRPDPSNATFIFDDGPITLKDGRNERELVPNSAFIEETVILDQFSYGDINDDKKTDAALMIARYGSGSGTFIYVAVFASGPVSYAGSKAIFIGDRISPQSISINDGIITVGYLGRDPGEALAAEPTVSMSKQFIWRSGELQER